MTTPERRPIRMDFRIEAPGSVSAPPPWAVVPGSAAPPSPATALAGRSTSAETRLLKTLWYSDGGGQGGRPLDEALTNLGESYIQGGRVVWELPTDLDSVYADYLSESVAQLNRLIEQGVMEIDSDGNIRPSGTEAMPTSAGEA